jgi:DNA-binding NarL/FixJ family response regulator
MIKLLIVDDQKILLDGFVKLFASVADFEIVGSITLADLVDVYCYQKAPDLVLMDICMESKISGIYITRDLKEKYRNLKVILMTGFPEISFVEKAKAAGADSFIYKDCSAEEFIQCIRATMAGEHIYPQVSSRDTFGFSDARLTKREMEILSLACRNLSRKEIADQLSISESTVNFHINNMLCKTGHKSIIGLAVEAANKGYVEPKLK